MSGGARDLGTDTDTDTGRDVLVLRPEPEAGETARAVARLGWRPIVSPLLAIEAVDPGPLPPFEALVLSSSRAVPHAPPAPAFVVGERTAAAFEARGGTLLAVEPDGARLAATIRATIRARGRVGRLLHLAGDEVAFDFARALDGVERRTVYRAVPQRLADDARAALLGGGATALLTSPRIARLLAAEGRSVRALALSDAVAHAWHDSGGGDGGRRVEIARTPDMAALLELLGQAPQP